MRERERDGEGAGSERRHRGRRRIVERTVLRADEPLREDRREPVWILAFSGIAILLVGLLAAGHYFLNQEIHRLWKALAGILLSSVFVVRPEWTVYALPLTFAYTEWLPKSPIPGVNSLNLMNYVILFTWLGRSALQRRRLIEPSPLNRPLLVFLLCLTLAYVHGSIEGGNLSPIRALQAYWTYIMGLVLFFPLHHSIRTWRDVKRLAFWYAIASSLGVIGMGLEFADAGGTRRVGGPIGDINVAGAFFALAALFAIGMVRAPGLRIMQRVGLLASTAASAAAMLMSGSRGAIVGLFVGGLPQAFRAGAVGVLCTALLLGGIVVGSPGVVKNRFQETLTTLQSGEGDEAAAMNESSGGRIDIWKSVLRIAVANPLFGVGFGQLPRHVEADIGRYKVAHNLYLDILGEQGFPGLVVLLWFFYAAWRMSVRLGRSPGFAGVLGITATYMLLALFVSNLFGQRLFHFSMSGTLSFTMAIVSRALSLQQEEANAAAGAENATPVPGAEGFALGEPRRAESGA